MKIMVSQPMAGKTDKEILAIRDAAIEYLKSKDYEVINTLFDGLQYSEEAILGRGVKNIPLYYLAKSLEKMSVCDAVYFCKGWENARGCRIEHEAAKAYELEILYEGVD